MRLSDLHAQLNGSGVHVVLGHGLTSDAIVNYRYVEGERFSSDDEERRTLDLSGSGIVVRRSGWVWILGTAGRITAGYSTSKREQARVNDTLAVLLEVLGITGTETIGPDDDPVFAVPDEQENPDDPREVAG